MAASTLVVDVGGELCELHSRMDLVKRISVRALLGLALPIGNRLLSRCVSKTKDGLLGVLSVNIFVGYKVDSSLEYVYGFVNPFRRRWRR